MVDYRGSRTGVALALAACAIAGLATPARSGWTFEMHGGAPLVPDRVVHITQAGFPDLDIDGRMRSEPHEMPFYYDFRLIRWGARHGWALDFLHHKLILDNPPPEVQDLQFTHGYNMVSLQRLWRVSDYVLMAGAGVVLTHVESTVRGRVFDQHQGVFGWGYYVSGPLAVVGVGRRLDLGERFYLSGDVRASWSHVDVDVVDGGASMTDVGLHFLAGAGARF
ncbi:hypothetical protein KKG45_05860 [bacterium]|nr:hypothetical protein [bacterium]MBU1072753.1 hypothetical protein [bacterium]MBU1675047.1 hypothetical protein [bacterium]